MRDLLALIIRPAQVRVFFWANSQRGDKHVSTRPVLVDTKVGLQSKTYNFMYEKAKNKE